MKRRLASVILTSLWLTRATAQGPGPRTGAESTDIAVRSVRGIGPASASQLCVGPRNSIRVELAHSGPAPSRPIALRLVMVLPGGDQSGVLVAEGSATFAPGATTAAFTFLNVDVPLRMQGRAALLEVRVNHGGAVQEQNLSNNGGVLALDTVTDWSCR